MELGTRHPPDGAGRTVTRTAQWRGWLVFAGLFVLFVFLFQSILLPFVAGLAVAYFLDPAADWLERKGLSRALAAAVVLVFFILVMVATVLLLLPLLQAQVVDLVRRLPEYVSALQHQALDLADLLRASLSEEDIERLRSGLSSNLGAAFTWLGGVIKGLVGGGLALFNLLTLLFVTPIVAFYLLRDWDRIVATVDGLLPREHLETIREQARIVDSTLAGFVRGQASVCLILGVFYAVGLTLAGLDFGFVVGLVAGLISFIPYVGSIFGLVASVGLALVQFDDFLRVGIVAAIFLGGQAVEGNVLTPKLVGDRVNLHPVWVIFALFAGGALFGFVGLLLAVPVAAVVGVFVRFAIAQYRESGMYDSRVSEEAPVVEVTPSDAPPEDWP